MRKDKLWQKKKSGYTVNEIQDIIQTAIDTAMTIKVMV